MDNNTPPPSPRKRCPLSFGFAISRQVPNLGVTLPGQPRTGTELVVGFDCIGDKCAWWREAHQSCVVHELADKAVKLLNLAEGE